MVCITCTQMDAACAEDMPVGTVCSKSSSTNYMTVEWDPSREHHTMWEAFRDYEGQALGDTEFLNQPGMECCAVLMGSDYVARLRKGSHLCEELDNVNHVSKTFSEKEINFSKDGLIICLPVRSFFLKPSNGSNDYANLFILPKAKGHSLIHSLLQGIDADCMGDILWSVGRALGIFQMFFMKDHKTHVTTAKHGDMGIGNIFYDRVDSMGKNQWVISWIDCTHMYLEGEGPLMDIGHLTANIERRCLNTRMQSSQVDYFKEKILEGYCAGLSQSIIRRLHEMLIHPQSFKDESWLLGEKIGSMGDPKKILKHIHQFFGYYLESHL